MVWVAMTLGTALSGTVQMVTGFGSVVLMMIMFPFFFNMIDAPMLALSINMLFTIIMCWRYRKDINWNVILWPTAVYSVVGFLVTGMVGDADLHVLVIVFAVFLMLLSLYFLLLSGKVKAKPKTTVGIGCAVFAGVSAGLFAIGGPPMAPYVLAATDDHKSYVASMQFMFVITNVINLAGRMVNGIFNWTLWPYILVGSPCILVGMKLGEVVSARLKPEMIRTCVYAFVGISGLILLLQQI
ncbi:MAG: sulfite exporter TauE/SafE family protein [Clostridiales bacterium]|nr:sulfite exporter TauE/SafE family protein [Candidatus Cacconaster stercorequi]